MADKMLNLAQVREAAGGVSASTIYRWMEAGEFPKAKRVGPTAVRWLDREITAWQNSRPDYSEQRDAA